MSGFVPSAFFPANGGGLPVPELDPPTYTTPSTGDYITGGYHAFDGVDAYIDLGRITAAERDAPDPWTISAWCKSTATGNRVIFCVRGTSEINFYQNSYNLNVFILLGSIYTKTKSNVLFPGWNHILLVSDGTDVNGWVNGVLITGWSSSGSYPAGPATWSPSTTVTIGATNSPIFYYGGDIAEVAMWSTDQSANVAAIYNNRVRHDLMNLASPPDILYVPLTSYGDNPDGTVDGVFEAVAGNNGTGAGMLAADAKGVLPATVTSTLTKALDIATSVVTTTKVKDVISGTGGTGSSFP